MERRNLIAALACWPATRLCAQAEPPRPRHKIPAAQLHEALAKKFPLRLGVAGLVQLVVTAPALHLLPARNKMGAALLAQVSGPRIRRSDGELDLVFGLRYEASDRSLRATRPEILGVRWPGMAQEQVEAVQSLLPAIARRMGEFTLHTFAPGELALADTMGLEPHAFEVVEDGLVVLFGPKGSAPPAPAPAPAARGTSARLQAATRAA